jgi:hypothetical protein
MPSAPANCSYASARRYEFLAQYSDGNRVGSVTDYDVDVGDKTMFWMGMVPLPT